MINVDIDLVPYGILDPKLLKRIRIWNDGTGDHYNGNYKYEIIAGNGKVYRRGTIQGSPQSTDLSSHSQTLRELAQGS